MNSINNISNLNLGKNRLIANSNIGNINRMNCTSSSDDTSGGDSSDNSGDSRNKPRSSCKTYNYNQKEQNMNQVLKKCHTKHKHTFIY